MHGLTASNSPCCHDLNHNDRRGGGQHLALSILWYWQEVHTCLQNMHELHEGRLSSLWQANILSIFPQHCKSSLATPARCDARGGRCMGLHSAALQTAAWHSITLRRLLLAA